MSQQNLSYAVVYPINPVYHIFKTSGYAAQYLVEDTAQAMAILSRQLQSKPGPCSIAITTLFPSADPRSALPVNTYNKPHVSSD